MGGFLYHGSTSKAFVGLRHMLCLRLKSILHLVCVCLALSLQQMLCDHTRAHVAPPYLPKSTGQIVRSSFCYEPSNHDPNPLSCLDHWRCWCRPLRTWVGFSFFRKCQVCTHRYRPREDISCPCEPLLAVKHPPSVMGLRAAARLKIVPWGGFLGSHGASMYYVDCASSRNAPGKPCASLHCRLCLPGTTNEVPAGAAVPQSATAMGSNGVHQLLEHCRSASQL